MQKISSLLVCLALLAPAAETLAQKNQPKELFVFCENNNCGYMDNTGKVIIQPQFKNAQDFSDGLALVLTEQQVWGYIDKTGQMVIKGASPLRNQFSEGLAAFEVYNSLGGNKWGYIDKKGKIASEPEFEEASDFSDVLACV